MPRNYTPKFKNGLYLRKSTGGRGFGKVWWVRYTPVRGGKRRQCALHLAPEWEYVDQVEGVRRPTGPIYDKKEANRVRGDLQKIIDQCQTLGMQAAEPTSLKEMVQWFLEYQEGPTKASVPGTLRSYQNILKTFMKRIGGTTLITRVNPDHIDSYLHWLNEQKGLIPRTVEQHRKALKAFFNAVVKKRRIIRYNPTDAVDPWVVTDTEKFVLSGEQGIALLGCLDPQYRSLGIYYLNSGVRKMEPTLLQWKHVDFEHMVISQPLEKTKKSLPFRSLPMSRDPRAGSCYNLWRFLTKLHNGQAPEAYVFTTNRGDPPSASTIETVFKSAARPAGIPTEGPRPHFTIRSFRYTYRTQLRGVSSHISSRLMGHRSIDVHNGYLGDVSDEIRRAAAQVDWNIFPEDERRILEV